MKQFELYFVGFRKHGEVQHLEGGPFVSYDAADAARAVKEEAHGGSWVVCKATLPFEIVEDY